MLCARSVISGFGFFSCQGAKLAKPLHSIPKSEFPNPKQMELKIGTRKSKTPILVFVIWNIVCVFDRFEFVSDFEFRASDFLLIAAPYSSPLTLHSSRLLAA